LARRWFRFLSRGGVVENKKFRVNQFIKAHEVRLIDSDGKMFGVVKLVDALSKARLSGLDLVEISPQASPPVCRVVDFAKFKYESEKKTKENRKKQRVPQIKEIRIRSRISEHDLGIKIKRARGFIALGSKVQITAIFSGREMQHKDLGVKVIDKIKKSLSDVAESDGKFSSIGNRVLSTLIPKKKVK
jgi:translation initiation factor IF-3